MNCMKCGRETQEDQVFCLECQIDMARHPVKPETVVNLPQRSTELPPKKQPHRWAVTEEDQIKKLNRRCRVLTILLAVVMVLSLLYVAISTKAVQRLLQENLVGRNYSTIGQDNGAGE